MAVSELADLHQPNHQPVLNRVRPLRDTSVGKVAAMYAEQPSTSQARSCHAWTTSDETCKGSSCNVDSSTSASASPGSAATVARMVAQPTDEAFHFIRHVRLHFWCTWNGIADNPRPLHDPT